MKVKTVKFSILHGIMDKNYIYKYIKSHELNFSNDYIYLYKLPVSKKQGKQQRNYNIKTNWNMKILKMNK